MTTIVKRVVGALLALVGLVLVVVGVWFATQLGSLGTARFTVHPDTTDPVLVGPDLLNRVDEDIVVTATPAEGGSVWVALANPSDVNAVVGTARHVAVTGVSVRDWSLTTATSGSGSAPALGAADLWRQQDDGDGPVSLTVEQAHAPETLVVATDGGELSTLTLTVIDKTWFVEAVVAALVGLFLLVAGIVLLAPRRHRPVSPSVPPERSTTTATASTAGPEATASTAGPEATASVGPADAHDPEEVIR